MLSGFTSAITISVFGTSNMSAFSAASKRLDKFAGGFEKASERVKKAGLKMVLVGAGLAASLAMPAIQMGKFDTQVARVGGIADATAGQVAAIGDTAMYLGAKTSYTAQQVAEGQAALASMGLTAGQVADKTGIMASTITFATGQQVEMAEAGTLLVGTLKSYGRPMSDATAFSDMMTRSFSKSALKFGDLMEALRTSAPTSAGFGQSIETNIALLGILADRTITGSNAGTMLSMSLTNLYTQSEKVKKALGVSVYDAATGKARDFSQVLLEMKDNLGGMTDEARNLALNEVFGARGVKAVNALLSASKDEIIGLRAAIAGAEGAAADFEKRLLDTPTGHWLLMKSAIDGVSMTIGSHLMPNVIKLMDGIKGLADATFEWMRAHPLLTKLAVGFMGLAAFGLLAGGVLLFLGGGLLHLIGLALQLPAKLGQVALSMGVTNSAAVPLTTSLKALGLGALKMIAPFVLVGLAVYALMKAWDTDFMGLKDAVLETWAAVRPSLLALWGTVKAMGQGAAEIFDATIGAVWRWARGWAKALSSGVPPILRFVGLVAWSLGFLVGSVLRAWDWIQENPIITGLLFASLVAFTWPFIWSAVTAVWTFATQTVLAGTTAAWGFVVARIAAIRTAAAYLWNARSAILLNAQIVAVAAVTKIWTGVQWLLNAALSANPIGLIVGGVFLLGAAIGWVYNKFDAFRKLIDGVVGAIKGFFGIANKVPGVDVPMEPASMGAGVRMASTQDAPWLRGAHGGHDMMANPDALARPLDFKPARPVAGLQPGRSITHQNRSVSVDKRITVGKIEVTAAAGTPAQSIRDQVVEGLSALAGQEVGLEDLVYAP
jgi:TP901 family phage tail tape measure protein